MQPELSMEKSVLTSGPGLWYASNVAIFIAACFASCHILKLK